MEEEEDEEEEDPGFRKDAYEQPMPSDSEEAGPGRGEGGAEREAEGESDKDDVLMEGDQVADFASSMLEAISCWHYRARALLSIGVPTVRLSATIGFPVSCSTLPTPYASALKSDLTH